MDFWSVFWSVYPGSVLAFTVFFTRYIHWSNRFITKEDDKYSPGEAVAKGFMTALIWPAALFFGGLMHSLRAKERRAIREAVEKKNRREEEAYAQRIFEVAHRTVRQHYIDEHIKWMEQAGDAWANSYERHKLHRDRRYWKPRSHIDYFGR
jgi:hypothetical protein